MEETTSTGTPPPPATTTAPGSISSSSSSSGCLPTSPAARAFFAALDSKNNGTQTTDDGGQQQQQQQQRGGNNNNNSNNNSISKRINTLGWRNRWSQDEYYPVTLNSNNKPPKIQFTVRQVQRGEIEGTYGTGATVWPASLVLLKYLERHSDRLVKGKRVIDLGSGTGVTSIAAACFGADEVVCTDGESNVVALARDNIDAASKVIAEIIPPTTSTRDYRPGYFGIGNALVHVQEYWWGSGDIEGGNEGDLIIVSDCVLPKLYPIAPLVNALDQLLVGTTAVAVISYEHRYFPLYDPKEKFIELSKQKGLTVEVVPIEEQDEVYSVDDIEIWLVHRCQSA